jgi:hypothetical protein
MSVIASVEDFSSGEGVNGSCECPVMMSVDVTGIGVLGCYRLMGWTNVDGTVENAGVASIRS